MDNYFSSPKLFCKLYRNGTGACGTLRINRAGVPDTISKAKMKKGDPIITDKVDNLTFISWYDKKRVNLVSSVHNTSTFLSRTRSKDSPDGFRTVEKPKPIELNTRYMRGIDLADQNMWYGIKCPQISQVVEETFVCGIGSFILQLPCPLQAAQPKSEIH